MTQDQLVARLRLESDQESQPIVARRYGFSQSYLNRVLKGQSPISPRLAESLGYRRVVRFEPLR